MARYQGYFGYNDTLLKIFKSCIYFYSSVYYGIDYLKYIWNFQKGIATA